MNDWFNSKCKPCKGSLVISFKFEHDRHLKCEQAEHKGIECFIMILSMITAIPV